MFDKSLPWKHQWNYRAPFAHAGELLGRGEGVYDDALPSGLVSLLPLHNAMLAAPVGLKSLAVDHLSWKAFGQGFPACPSPTTLKLVVHTYSEQGDCAADSDAEGCHMAMKNGALASFLGNMRSLTNLTLRFPHQKGSHYELTVDIADVLPPQLSHLHASNFEHFEASEEHILSIFQRNSATPMHLRIADTYLRSRASWARIFASAQPDLRLHGARISEDFCDATEVNATGASPWSRMDRDDGMGREDSGAELRNALARCLVHGGKCPLSR